MKNYTIRFVQPWVFFAILVGGLLLCFGSLLLLSKSIEVSKLLCIAWVGVWGIIGYWLIKKVAIRELTATLTAEALLIQAAHLTGKQQIPLNQIASYTYHDFNDNKHLIFRLHSGQKIVFRHQGALCADDDIAALAADFDKQRLHEVDKGNSIKRGKTFFEKPVSTVLLIALTPTIGYLLWAVICNERPIRGGFFGAIGGYLSYLAAWIAATNRRNQKF